MSYKYLKIWWAGWSGKEVKMVVYYSINLNLKYLPITKARSQDEISHGARRKLLINYNQSNINYCDIDTQVCNCSYKWQCSFAPPPPRVRPL